MSAMGQYVLVRTGVVDGMEWDGGVWRKGGRVLQNNKAAEKFVGC